MRRIVMALAVTAAAFVGNTVVAQEQAGVPKDVVNELEYLVGTWEFEGKMGDDAMAGTVSYRWARDKKKEKYGLLQNWSYKHGDTPVTGVGLMAWHAAWNCLVESGCNSAGDCFQTHWVLKSPKEWQGEVTDSIDGREVEGRGVLVKGPAEFVYEGEFTTGEVGRVVFKKVAKERRSRKAKEEKQ